MTIAVDRRWAAGPRRRHGRAARRRRALPWRRMGVVLVAAAVPAGVAAWWLVGAGPQDGAPRAADETFTSERVGYSFRYPEGWPVRERGRTATVTSPRRDLAISFGVGPTGTLLEASERFVRELGTGYRGVRLIATQTARIAGDPALQVSGTAVNRSGVHIRFLSISVGAPDRNYAIAVFTLANTDPRRTLPVAQEIVASFRAPPPPAG